MDDVLEALSQIQRDINGLNSRVGRLGQVQEQMQRDVNSRLGQMQRDIGQMQRDIGQMQRDIGQINLTLDQIQVKPAKEKAKALTISLFTCSIIGHGVLLRCQDNDGKKRFAILTAAHVAVEAFHWFQTGCFKKVQFLSGKEYEIDKETPAELFVHPEYVRKGIHDFGVLIVSFKTMSSECQDLVLSIDDPFDTEHFGRASDVQFKSTPTMVNELRVRLQTGSKPDCRGTPLFSPRGELLSVVHGDSNHRGGRHTRLHSGDGDKLSTYVYVDMVKDLGELPYWEDECAKCLHHLESLTEEEEKNPHLKLKKPKSLTEEEEKNPPASTPDAFLKDHFTLAEICDEIISHAQAKSNITLADRLSLSESGTYQAACC